jgi:ribosomal protein L19
MKSFFLKKNNNHISSHLISNYLTHLKQIKTNKNKIVNKSYVNKYIRRGEIINLQFLIYTNEVNKFSLNGIITKKNKKSNLNNSVTVKSLISGVQVKFNLHLYSDGIRLI